MYTAAIIGCGSIATAHAYGIARSGVARLTGLADIRRDAAHALADSFGVPQSACYGDYPTMMEEVHPDIVFIALWHGQHAEATIAAASRGARMIVCEKPMATSIGEAEQMMAACDREDVKLVVAHQRRFFPGWSRARECVANGEIGKPLHAWLRVKDGMLNSATHSIDLARFVLGDPAATSVTSAVQRHTDRFERGRPAEDSALALIEFAGDVRVLVESDLGAEHISANAVVVGTDGMLSIEENYVRLMNSKEAGWQRLSGAPFGTDDPSVVPDPLARPLYELVEHFGTANIEPFVANYVEQVVESVAWLEGSRAVHRGDAVQGYRTLEILMAIYESARCGETTYLPLETRANPLELMIESGALPVSRPGRYDIRSSLVREKS